MKRLWILLACLVAFPAQASYDASAVGDVLTGTFSSTHDQPITIGLWVKKADWTASNAYYLALADDTADLNSMVAINSLADDTATAIVVMSTGSSTGATHTFSSAGVYDNTWVCVVATFVDDAERHIYVEDSTNTTGNFTSRDITNVLDTIVVGAAANSAARANALLAEVAIWSGELSTANIDAYCGASATPLSADQVDNANLLGYWPLDTDQATHTDQSGNGGPSLSEQSGIPFSADHPTINSGASAPTFTGNPTVTNTTDTAITFSYTASASGDTVYGSLRDTADAAFTCAQIIAETDTHGPNSEATTGSADSIILTSADTPEFPTYDADFCIRNGASNDSAVFTVSDIDLDAPTGFQFVEITSIGTGSPCESFNTATAPDIVATDWLLAPTTVSPGSYALTIGADCQFSYNDSGAGTKQTALNTAVYDQSVGAYHADDIDFIANNNAPTDNGTLGGSPVVLDEDTAMTTIDICGGFDDLDGDQLTITRTGDVSGAHDGAGNAAVLTDSGEAWTTNQFIGYTLSNTTDGSSCVVTENTATTATCTLTGGAENDWDIGDAHTIVGALPTGISLGGTGSCDLSGTPTTEDETGITIEFTATDDANDSDALSILFYVVDTWTRSDDTGGTVSASLTSIQSDAPWIENVSISTSAACSETVAEDDIISQDPEAGEVDAPEPEFSAVVSTGPCPIVTNSEDNALATVYTSAAVPNGAAFRSGTARAPSGMYVTTCTGSTISVRGIAHRNDGAMCIDTTATVEVELAGWGLTNAGVVVADTCEASFYANGIPRGSDGSVCMTDVD